MFAFADYYLVQKSKQTKEKKQAKITDLLRVEKKRIQKGGKIYVNWLKINNKINMLHIKKQFTGITTEFIGKCTQRNNSLPCILGTKILYYVR